MIITKENRNNILIFITIFLLDILSYLFISKKKYDFHIGLLDISHHLILVGVYYLNYRFFGPLILKKKFIKYLLGFFCLVLFYAVLRYFLQEIIIFKFTGLHNYNFETMSSQKIAVALYFDSFYYTLRFCLISSVVYLLHRHDDNKTELNKLQLNHQKAQLNALKSQIGPHFLFNTLNNFYVELIDDKPETAKDILKLSNLMRFVTYETDNDYINLANEIDFIENYLHFYKRRYEENYSINFTVNGIIKNQQIPNLTLLHFIENVCKHGIINNSNKPASIQINISEKYLEVITENHSNTSNKYSEKGIGTENITKRLDVLFGKSFILKNTENNPIFRAYLKIPLQ